MKRPSTPCPALASAFRQSGRAKAAIARDVGRSRRTLYAWLNGESSVPLDLRPALKDALGVPVDWRVHDEHHDQPHLVPETPDTIAGGAPASSSAPPATMPVRTPPYSEPLSGPQAGGNGNPLTPPADPTPPPTAPPERPTEPKPEQDPFDWLFGDDA